jgi:hypothetical protein
MELNMGELVSVSSAGLAADGIVFDTPSSGKVVVAMMDPVRGPLFRTVNATTVSERAEAGTDDHALHLLIRRTPAPVHGAARGAARGGSSRREGYKRGAAHRSTGK